MRSSAPSARHCAAYLADAVVVTPNPRVHALFADKRNLALLSDPALLRSWGVSAETLADLSAVPRTVLVAPRNAQALWRERKTLFFKPAVGYGSKAVYRGDRTTRRVWGEILRGQYQRAGVHAATRADAGQACIS